MTLILGRKEGMTQVFTEDGAHVGVTVVSAGPCVVTQVRTKEADGYEALQLGYADKREKRTKKPQIGHFAKAGTAPKRFLREERLNQTPEALSVGATITCDVFAAKATSSTSSARPRAAASPAPSSATASRADRRRTVA